MILHQGDEANDKDNEDNGEEEEENHTKSLLPKLWVSGTAILVPSEGRSSIDVILVPTCLSDQRSRFGELDALLARVPVVHTLASLIPNPPASQQL